VTYLKTLIWPAEVRHEPSDFGGSEAGNQLPADADADAYIAAVEAADGQALEAAVTRMAINSFVQRLQGRRHLDGD
jgi:hypothetical protein